MVMAMPPTTAMPTTHRHGAFDAQSDHCEPVAMCGETIAKKIKPQTIATARKNIATIVRGNTMAVATATATRTKNTLGLLRGQRAPSGWDVKLQ